MPPTLLPSARVIPTITRALHTSTPAASASASASAAPAAPAPAAPSKDHHVISYPPEAFPEGYKVGSTHAGIKKNGKLDLGVLISTRPLTSAAACMTRNVFKAAPVTVSAELLHKFSGRAKGFIVNSGCANAVTGSKGLENAWKMSKTVTERVETQGEGEGGTLVMSTGVIGQHVPIDSIVASIPKVTDSLVSTPEGWLDLARAFMTTDTFPKLRTKSFNLAGQTIKFAGIDKGAGMIAPNMGGPPQPPHATLLGVIATDAAVEPKSLQSALEYAVDRSFNSITVDGDMSTNDTIVCLANGAAAGGGQGKEINESANPEEFKVFREELRTFAEELAQLVVRDGEGATKFVTVTVKGAPSFDVANAVAKSVASSALVKTAMYGEDANWGRILCAVGYTALPPNASITPTKVSVEFHPKADSANPAPLRLLTNGEPEADIDEARASEILKEEDLEVVVDLGDGVDEAKVWTCDFSHEYVTINGSYRS